MDTLLSHYAGDVICIIFPGLLFIGLYGRNFLKCVKITVKKNDSPPFLLPIFILLGAWFVGKTFETAVYTPIAIYRYCNHDSQQSANQETRSTNTETTQTNAAKATTDTSDIQLYKIQQKDWKQAAVGGFRNLFAVSLCAWIWPPKTISRKKLSRWYGFLATLIFGSCWVIHHIQVYGINI